MTPSRRASSLAGSGFRTIENRKTSSGVVGKAIVLEHLLWIAGGLHREPR